MNKFFKVFSNKKNNRGWKCFQLILTLSCGWRKYRKTLSVRPYPVRSFQLFIDKMVLLFGWNFFHLMLALISDCYSCLECQRHIFAILAKRCGKKTKKYYICLATFVQFISVWNVKCWRRNITKAGDVIKNTITMFRWYIVLVTNPWNHDNFCMATTLPSVL
jgi:hypothetical protein